MDKVLLNMRVDISLVYRSSKTRHYSYHHRNDDDEIYEEEGFEVYPGEESLGRRSLDTIHSSSSNL